MMFWNVFFIVFAVVCPFGMWSVVNNLFNSEIKYKWFRNFCTTCSIVLFFQLASVMFIAMDTFMKLFISLFK